MRKRRPVRLVYAEWFDDVEVAFARAEQIQGWRREKKLALIADRGADLPRLPRPGPAPVASTSTADNVSPHARMPCGVSSSAEITTMVAWSSPMSCRSTRPCWHR